MCAPDPRWMSLAFGGNSSAFVDTAAACRCPLCRRHPDGCCGAWTKNIPFCFSSVRDAGRSLRSAAPATGGTSTAVLSARRRHDTRACGGRRCGTGRAKKGGSITGTRSGHGGSGFGRCERQVIAPAWAIILPGTRRALAHSPRPRLRPAMVRTSHRRARSLRMVPTSVLPTITSPAASSAGGRTGTSPWAGPRSPRGADPVRGNAGRCGGCAGERR